MTQDMEEKLIQDVGSIGGKLDRFLIEWDSRKTSLASCSDVEAVDNRLTTHIETAKHRGTTAGMWIASGAAVIAAIAAVLGIKP